MPHFDNLAFQTVKIHNSWLNDDPTLAFVVERIVAHRKKRMANGSVSIFVKIKYAAIEFPPNGVDDEVFWTDVVQFFLQCPAITTSYFQVVEPDLLSTLYAAAETMLSTSTNNQ